VGLTTRVVLSVQFRSSSIYETSSSPAEIQKKKKSTTFLWPRLGMACKMFLVFALLV
jgi:hypothetical protein